MVEKNEVNIIYKTGPVRARQFESDRGLNKREYTANDFFNIMDYLKTNVL